MGLAQADFAAEMRGDAGGEAIVLMTGPGELRPSCPGELGHTRSGELEHVRSSGASGEKGFEVMIGRTTGKVERRKGEREKVDKHCLLNFFPRAVCHSNSA